MKGKSKKGVSWNQEGRNRKLLGKAAAADSLEIGEAIESKAEKKILQGFNSVQSCSNCNPPCVAQSFEISRHGFTNHSEFTDQALLEELIIRIKKGCLEIKKSSKDFVLVTECRWDLRDEPTNYQISLQELMDIQNQFRRLEDENKLCSICLERKKDDSIFCKFCWDRETKQRGKRSEVTKNLIK